jgi:hypothetical protein
VKAPFGESANKKSSSCRDSNARKTGPAPVTQLDGGPQCAGPATSSPACATTVAAAGQGKVELLTGIEGASSRPVRRIVLVDG